MKEAEDLVATDKLSVNFVCLVWGFYVPVNSYCHVKMVGSPYHTFSLASLTKRLTIILCSYFHL